METSPLKREEAARLLLIEDKRDKLFFAIGLYAGRRVSEILSIKWGWLLDDRGPKIWIPKQKKWLYFPKCSSLVKIINECYNGQKKDDYVFKSKRGGDGALSKSAINDRIIPKYFEKLQIKTRTEASHCLRKTFAVRFLEDNKEKEDMYYLLLWLMDYFGHRDLKTTINYIGIKEKKLGQLVENIVY